MSNSNSSQPTNSSDTSTRIAGVLAYLIPILGWIYVYVFYRKNVRAMFHLRQSIGLVIFLVGTFVGWAVIGWLLAWIPYVALISISLFAVVISAFICGVVVWVFGLLNALQNKVAPLPLFGQWADSLPIK